MERYFPSVPDEVFEAITVIRRLAAQDPGYFDDPDCPYGPTIRNFFGQDASEAPRGRSFAGLEAEIENLIEDMNETAEKLDEEEDTTRKMQFFRTKTSLLDKLMGLKERALGLKQQHEFQEMVLRFIDDVLEPGQRTEFIDKFGAWIKS